MAFATPTAVKVNTLAVGNQVVAAVAADGHCYVQPTPTATGAQYPTVQSIVAPVLPPGANAGDGLYTVYLTGSAFSQPIDFTLNATTDWVITTTGNA
jgi:hypothetical protein